MSKSIVDFGVVMSSCVGLEAQQAAMSKYILTLLVGKLAFLLPEQNARYLLLRVCLILKNRGIIDCIEYTEGLSTISLYTLSKLVS